MLQRRIYNVVDRPLNEWMTDDILTLKAIRRKNELIWRKTRTTINFDIYYDTCKAVKRAIQTCDVSLYNISLLDVMTQILQNEYSVAIIYQLFYFGIYNKYVFYR